MSEVKYKLTVTVISDKEHPPIMFSVIVPEDLALMLMATPIRATSIAISRAGGIELDKTGLLDFR